MFDELRDRVTHQLVDLTFVDDKIHVAVLAQHSPLVIPPLSVFDTLPINVKANTHQ